MPRAMASTARSHRPVLSTDTASRKSRAKARWLRSPSRGGREFRRKLRPVRQRRARFPRTDLTEVPRFDARHMPLKFKLEPRRRPGVISRVARASLDNPISFVAIAPGDGIPSHAAFARSRMPWSAGSTVVSPGGRGGQSRSLREVWRRAAMRCSANHRRRGRGATVTIVF